MAHTASFYWIGKLPASIFFTTAPFGLDPIEHQAWIVEGGGQELVGRALRAFRRQGLPCRQHRSVDGRMVPRRGEKPCRREGVAHPRAGRRRRGLRPARRDPGDARARRSRAGARTWRDRRGRASRAGERRVARASAPGEILLCAGLQQAERRRRSAGVALTLSTSLPEDLRAVIANACEAEHSAGLAEAEKRQRGGDRDARAAKACASPSFRPM